MKSERRSKMYFIAAALLALTLVMSACDNESNDDEEKFTPSKIISIGALVSITPDATVDEKNVSQMFKEFDSGKGSPNTVQLSCFQMMIMCAMVCPGAGSANLQYCSENPLSYDVEFDGCMSDETNGIESGVMSIDAYPDSPNLLSATYDNVVYVYMGMSLPPTSAALEYYTMKSGKVLGFMGVAPGVFFVLGVDPDGVPCDFTTTPATVLVDFDNNLWMSADGSCGLPTTPVYY